MIHMPSGREPQPYIYPGCTAEQIQAFEHYKRKCPAQPDFTYDPVSAEPDNAPNAATFAPYRSPRTPAATKSTKELQAVRQTQLGNVDKDRGPPPLHRKPIGSAPTPSAFAVPPPSEHLARQAPAVRPGVSSSSAAMHYTDLSQLPRVRLVRPELASTPQHRAREISGGKAGRKCSLGCESGADDITGGGCRERRKASVNARPPRSAFFEHDEPAILTCERIDPVTEALVGLLSCAMDAALHFPLPRLALLGALRSPHTTPQQRLECVKTSLALAGQVVGVLMGLMLVWRLGAAVVQVVEALLWPVIMPFRILRWLAGGG